MNVFQNQHEVQQSGHIKSFPNGKVSEKTKILVQSSVLFQLICIKFRLWRQVSSESLNFWLKKFFEEIVKENGER